MTLPDNKRVGDLSDSTIQLKMPKDAVRIANGIYEWINKINGFTVLALHYSTSPDKDKEWLDLTRPKYSDTDWAREQEMSDDIPYDTQRVFSRFTKDIHVTKLEYNPDLPVQRGFDPSGNHLACVWAQKDDDGRLNILREHYIHNIPLRFFAEEVIAISNQFYKGAEFYDYIDPITSDQTSATSEFSCVEILQALGLVPIYHRYHVRAGIRLMELLTISLLNKIPMLRVDSEFCPLLVEGFTGGYVWDADAKNPFKDGLYDHVMDCVRYIVTDNYTYDDILEKERELIGENTVAKEHIIKTISKGDRYDKICEDWFEKKAFGKKIRRRYID